MTDTVKVFLHDIKWPNGFIGPKQHAVNVPAYSECFIRGYLYGVYGEQPESFSVVTGVVSNG